MRRLALGLAALAAVVAIASVFVARRPVTHADAFYGTPLVPAKAARDFVLRDGSGRDAHVLDGAAAVTLLFFGYTHCPDACPLALASLGHAYRMLAPDRAARTRIVFVSVDPEHDTPAVVAAYVRTFDRHIVGLTDSRARLAPVWDAYGVRVDPRTHEIGHGDTIYAIDASARVRFIYPPDTSAKAFANDLTTLAR